MLNARLDLLKPYQIDWNWLNTIWLIYELRDLCWGFQRDIFIQKHRSNAATSCEHQLGISQNAAEVII